MADEDDGEPKGDRETEGETTSVTFRAQRESFLGCSQEYSGLPKWPYEAVLRYWGFWRPRVWTEVMGTGVS